mmetsp:Transcript_3951/g.6704  ORF Transcript_3951/g.6704 Transcript_3951/m.6704 type:complete len:238 (+) Transcript_3951:900-1613(+)
MKSICCSLRAWSLSMTLTFSIIILTSFSILSSFEMTCTDFFDSMISMGRCSNRLDSWEMSSLACIWANSKSVLEQFQTMLDSFTSMKEPSVLRWYFSMISFTWLIHWKSSISSNLSQSFSFLLAELHLRKKPFSAASPMLGARLWYHLCIWALEALLTTKTMLAGLAESRLSASTTSCEGSCLPWALGFMGMTPSWSKMKTRFLLSVITSWICITFSSLKPFLDLISCQLSPKPVFT